LKSQFATTSFPTPLTTSFLSNRAKKHHFCVRERGEMAMWIIALLLSLVLASGTAVAFDCAGVTFPPTVVLCSDPELLRLADERQTAFYQARARVGEASWPALWDDQKRWVWSYATACGVPPDRPPPNPVPLSVIECFKRAGEARVAYLRAYGIAGNGLPSLAASGAAAAGGVGPSFDCARAASPLPSLICGDAKLSRVDLSFNQAYWALYQQLGPAGRAQLKEQDLEFIQQVEAECGLPASGPLTMFAEQTRNCVENAYEKTRAAWIGQLTGPAREEAVRAVEEHLKLQRDLQQRGFLPGGPPDGVYGRDTRAGIIAWQSARGRPVSGFLSDADASALEQEVSTFPAAGRGALSAGDIPLQNNAGVYVVPVRINGVITLDFIVDSGASDVVIPADVAMTLARAGTISEADFIGKNEYVLADGSTLKSARFILHELKVGDMTISNVTASISSATAPHPLLGQSFLSKLGSWSIDNGRHVLRLSGLEN
jgi:clan AA aspartic protease (TIGR02281 family)